MRQSKAITIDDRRITVKEITVREIRSFWQDMETEPAGGVEGIYSVLARFLPVAVEDITIDGLDDLAPSEIQILYDTFMEVNTVFFKAARLIEGEDPIIVGLRKALLPLLMIRFAGLFAPDTPELGITVTASSSPPSES
jgi:hypothetical protein